MASAPLFVTKPFGKLRLYTDVADTAIFIADAHRDDGKRFVVRADEILSAFLELESAIFKGQRLAGSANYVASGSFRR